MQILCMKAIFFSTDKIKSFKLLCTFAIGAVKSSGGQQDLECNVVS